MFCACFAVLLGILAILAREGVVGHPEDSLGLTGMAAGGAGMFVLMTLMHRMFLGRR